MAGAIARMSLVDHLTGSEELEETQRRRPINDIALVVQSRLLQRTNTTGSARILLNAHHATDFLIQDNVCEPGFDLVQTSEKPKAKPSIGPQLLNILGQRYQDWGSGVLGPFHTEQEEPEVVPGFENVAGILRPASVPAANPAEAPAEEPAAAATSAAAEEDAPETDVRPTTPQTQSPEPAETEQAREEDEELSLMIEASITLDDGSVEVLRMKSCERASEAAARFVQEHSLKAWFEEPLRKYLKQVEEDAIRFPAKVEGDLSEIRRMFRK